MLLKKYQNDTEILDFKKNQNDCTQILYHNFFNKPKQTNNFEETTVGKGSQDE